jgi:hypothetical protein
LILSVRQPLQHFGPPELRAYPAWVVTRDTPSRNGGNSNKPPYLPNGHGVLAVASGPANERDCLPYEEARSIVLSGRDGMQWVGFTPRPDNPVCGVDADCCVSPDGTLGFSRPKGGAPSLGFWMPAVVSFLRTYWSFSPSGAGLRAWALGGLPDGHDNFSHIGFEMYASGQYLTETGRPLPGSPSHARRLPSRLDLLWRCASALNLAMRPGPSRPDFVLLWSRPGSSDSDMRLANLLRLRGKIHDAPLLSQLLLFSGAFRPKWLERHYADGRTYLDGLVSKALAGPPATAGGASEQALPNPSSDPEELAARRYAYLVADRAARSRLDAELAAVRPAPEPPEPAPALLAAVPAALSWRVSRLWLEGSSVLLSAAAKAGKTTLSLNLVRSLCDGSLFLDEFDCRPSRVVYSNLDMSRDLFTAWLRDLGLAHPERLAVWSWRGRRPSLHASERDRTAVIAALRAFATDVWIVDTWLGLFPGDENDNAATVAFCRVLSEICAAAGVSNLLVIHHMGRASSRPQLADREERSRGASALDGAFDNLWNLARDGDRRFLRCPGRDVGTDIEELALDYDAEFRRLIAVAGTRTETRALRDAARSSQAALTVRALVRSNPGLTGAKLRPASGLRERVHFAALREAEERGWIENRGSKRLSAWFATDYEDQGTDQDEDAVEGSGKGGRAALPSTARALPGQRGPMGAAALPSTAALYKEGGSAAVLRRPGPTPRRRAKIEKDPNRPLPARRRRRLASTDPEGG